jgi:hypothetical protein
MKLPALFALILIASIACAGAKSATTPVELLGCGNKSICIRMLIDVAPDNCSQIIVSPICDTEADESPDGYTTFHLHFQGKLKGQLKEIDSIFKGYTDGITCTAFGQGYVGFLGYTAAGNPIINSSAGAIEIVDSRLEIGCERCLVVHDKKTGKVIAELRSPGYDLLLTGYKPTEFFYDAPSGVNIKSGALCMRVEDGKPVSKVPLARCESSTQSNQQITFKGESCS